jgi:hypothetical protein
VIVEEKSMPAISTSWQLSGAAGSRTTRRISLTFVGDLIGHALR